MNKKNIFFGLLIIIFLAIIFYFKHRQYINPELLRIYFEGFGIWTPIIYGFIYLIAVFIPYAGTTMTIVGGLIFAPLFGTLFVITLTSLGSVLPFLLSKHLGRKYIESKFKKTKYEKYLTTTDENSFMFALYMRLIPLIPYELQNYILGLIDISTSNFIIATFFGLLPGTFVLIYLGNTLTDLQPTKIVILAIISLFSILLPVALKKFTKAKEVLQLDSKEK